MIDVNLGTPVVSLNNIVFWNDGFFSLRLKLN